MMAAFDRSLQYEIEEVNGSRVNALASIVAERYAALRWRLDRVDENKCDGYARLESDLASDRPVEVKAVRIEHHDGTGRLGIKYSSHEALAEADGVYAIVLYAEVEHAGQRRILVLHADLVDPEAVGEHLRADRDGYQKVRWDLLLDPEEIDRGRWGS